MPHSHRVDEPTGLFLGTVASPQSRPPLHPARSVYCGYAFQSRRRSRFVVATQLSLLASCFESAIAFGEDLCFPSFQLVQWRNVTDRAVKPNRIVMGYPQAHDPLRILQRQRHSRTDALGLYGFVPSLDLPIRLRIVRRCFHMRHPADADEFLEVLRNELRSVVRYDPRPRLRELLSSPLENDF